MKRFDRKSALKLINKYADECNRVNEEKKSLELEINDLKANISVNKEIIDKLLNPSISIDSKSKIIMDGIEKEKNLLIDRKKQLDSENKNLRKKIKYYENIINGDIEIHREKIKDLKDKIFILENDNKKKDSIILSLNQQLKNLRDKDIMDKLSHNEGNDDDEEENEDDSDKSEETVIIPDKIPKEIYVFDPTESLNIMQEDLILYKKAYENALSKIKEFRNLINKYEVKISDLNSQIYKIENSIPNQKVIHRNNNFRNNYIPQNNYNKKKIENENLEINEILKFTKISEEEIQELIQNGNKIISNLLYELNTILKDYKIKLEKISQENLELKETLVKTTNENLILYKTILEEKTKSNIYKYFTHRDKKTNIGDSYLNTDVSLMANVDDIKERKKSLELNIGMRVRNTEENFNQSADDIRNLVSEYEGVKKNNFTEVNSEETI